jgi:starch phosphorylase
MEIALDSHIPTYSGGLGVLAADTLRSAADRGVSMVGVSLAHRCGYFFQRIGPAGEQLEEPVQWSPDDWLVPVEAQCDVELQGRRVGIRAWRHTIVGATGSVVPVYLLDTDLPENDAADRRLTDRLYGGDQRYRLCQEVVLGIGGVRLLRALGYTDISRFHMNEGHSSLLALELLREQTRTTPELRDAAVAVSSRCVFTTHTPVPAGQDQFPRELADRVLDGEAVDRLTELGCCGETLNMTLVALHLSRYVNGVTRRHGEISRSMFPGYPIGSITNGVHSVTWTAAPFQALYDRAVPNWRTDPHCLRYLANVALEDVRRAHAQAKWRLVQEVNERTNAGFDKDVLTLGFARRATAYKRPTLLFDDPRRLGEVASKCGGLQIVLAGKAHPGDADGRSLVQALTRVARDGVPGVRIAFLPNYDVAAAQLLTAGVDVWLNTPRPPLEASGTSGMKAAHNGVPSVSTFDGWWIEGCVDGVTGWGIGPRDSEAAAARTDAEDAAELYRVLEERVAPAYANPAAWDQIMRSTIAVNASFFNTHRMIDEYLRVAYLGQGQDPSGTVPRAQQGVLQPGIVAIDVVGEVQRTVTRDDCGGRVEEHHANGLRQ